MTCERAFLNSGKRHSQFSCCARPFPVCWLLPSIKSSLFARVLLHCGLIWACVLISVPCALFFELAPRYGSHPSNIFAAHFPANVLDTSQQKLGAVSCTRLAFDKGLSASRAKVFDNLFLDEIVEVGRNKLWSGFGLKMLEVYLSSFQSSKLFGVSRLNIVKTVKLCLLAVLLRRSQICNEILPAPTANHFSPMPAQYLMKARRQEIAGMLPAWRMTRMTKMTKMTRVTGSNWQ